MKKLILVFLIITMIPGCTEAPDEMGFHVGTYTVVKTKAPGICDYGCTHPGSVHDKDTGEWYDVCWETLPGPNCCSKTVTDDETVLQMTGCDATLKGTLTVKERTCALPKEEYSPTIDVIADSVLIC